MGRKALKACFDHMALEISDAVYEEATTRGNHF